LEDAHVGAKVLDIVLTSRSKGKDGRIPMAGVPYHAVDSYLSKLVKAGYKVAICEQVSEPDNHGIVDREVIRIVTPGTVLDEVSLIANENNYIISIFQKKAIYGLSVADISTGQFEIEELSSPQELIDEVKRLGPSECILPPTFYNSTDFLGLLKNEKNINIYCFQQADFYAKNAIKIIIDQFGHSVVLEEVKNYEVACTAAAVLLGYLRYTQTDHISHFKTIDIVHAEDTMQLDFATITNLELFSTLRTKESKGTLMAHLDNTKTAMGGRLLKKIIKRPLISSTQIKKRQEVVEGLLNNTELHQQIIDELAHVGDIERILTRLSLGIGNARDLVVLRDSLDRSLQIKTIIPEDISLFTEIKKNIRPDLTEIVSLIKKTIVDNPPYSVKEGGLIKDGVDPKLDNLRNIVNGNSEWLQELEKKERDRTRIPNLKVRFNKVFGFYIEVSNSSKDTVPADYMRKQTLVNGERFITAELKEKEEFILKSEDEIQKHEYLLFLKVLSEALEKTKHIQQAAHQIAIIDCLSSFAIVSKKGSLNGGYLHNQGIASLSWNINHNLQSLYVAPTFYNTSNQVIISTRAFS
jgi:DNA mismatch repair protein MutS